MRNARGRGIAFVVIVVSLVAGGIGDVRAETIRDPLGVVAVGTTPADNAQGIVAISNGGCATGEVAVRVGDGGCSTAVGGVAVAAGNGTANGFVAASSGGSAMADCIEVSICFVRGVAVSGTGDAGSGGEEAVAVSGTGTSRATYFAASGTGTADASDNASVAVGVLGNGDAYLLSVSGDEEIRHTNACVLVPCDERVDDVLGAWYAVNAYVGMKTPFPASIPICGGGEPVDAGAAMTTSSAICSVDHYQDDCPEIIDGNGPWQIYEYYVDINGCTIPLRYGEHYGTHRGWGLEHINAERTDWSWGDFTRRLTQSALSRGYRLYPERDLIGSCLHYHTSGGRPRTWHVLVDYKYGKGIVTAFYRRGHNNCRF